MTLQIAVVHVMFYLYALHSAQLAVREKLKVELRHAPILLVAMRRLVVRLVAGPHLCDDASAASTPNGEADT